MNQGSSPESGQTAILSPNSTEIGAVVIGRNEGARLIRCLRAIKLESLVYVDSDSTDGSPDVAHALGAKVVKLDPELPLTAARARNAGFRELLVAHPNIRYVFFVDGDCEVCDGWVETAHNFLESHPDVAIVWGRRRERYPEQSVYNLVCDIEWGLAPAGEALLCGGDAVIRTSALSDVQGYREDLICGEEPEMCVRIRRKGWRIWHLDDDMTVHDAAMYRFGQWWTRMTRSGYASAQAAALYDEPPHHHWKRQSYRVWFWGLCFPAAVLALSFAFGVRASLLLAIYPLQIIRIAVRSRRLGRAAWFWAASVVLGKFPEMRGQLRFLLDRWRRTNARLIEYK